MSDQEDFFGDKDIEATEHESVPDSNVGSQTVSVDALASVPDAEFFKTNDNDSESDSLLDEQAEAALDEHTMNLKYTVYPQPSPNVKLLEGTFPKTVHFVPQQYDADSLLLDSVAADETEYSIRNTIRWRTDKDTSVDKSNTHLVRYYDGSIYLFVGNTPFSVKVIDDNNLYLYCTQQEQDLLQCHGLLSGKFIIKSLTIQSTHTRSKEHHAEFAEDDELEFEEENIKAKNRYSKRDYEVPEPVEEGDIGAIKRAKHNVFIAKKRTLHKNASSDSNSGSNSGSESN